MNKILVVEDDANINEVVCEYLKEAGFVVASVFSGDKAKEYIDSDAKISLFILDIMLPGVTGLALLKTIRSNPVYKHTPVMMLTALNDEHTQLTSFDGLADDYVSKPFSPKVLVKRVESLLRRTGEAGGKLEIGGISMDTERYEVFEDGEKITLTHKEFEMLRILAKNRKKVLTRQQLLDLVWGYDYYGDDRIIDVHIKNLRKKLRADVIVTVKGVGYKID